MFLRALAVFLALMAGAAWGADSITVKDIRIEGIQRTEAGTVFNYLPVKVGDTVDDAKAADAIRALFATGFFADVKIAFDGDVLVVTVQERPAIFTIDINGAKDITKDSLKDALKTVGIAESRIYDKSLIDRAEKELKRQYLGRGRYSAQVTTTVKQLERNRVALTFDIDEGEVARIREIHFHGNKVYSEGELLDLMVLTTPGWLTWYSKNDQYSKQKLSSDLETVRSYYQNRGYLEFAIDSTQVAITPDREGIYITVNITEGQRYTVSEISLAGAFPVPEEELRKSLVMKPGEAFSRERVTESSKRISDRLANDGYSFANVTPEPTLDKEHATAAFVFNIDPGRRVYVRRINIIGNAKTRDEVIRREIRQLEGGWYSVEKVNRSKTRLERLGFFSEINVETPAVAGTTDQVDVNFTVTERSTGSIQLGAGYSTSEKLILSTSVSQNNIFGTGNALTVSLNTGTLSRTIAVSYFTPYWTDEGIGRGFSVYDRKVDTASLTGVAPYQSESLGADMNFVVPLSETDAVGLGAGAERTRLGVFSTSALRYLDFVNRFGSTTTTFKTTGSFSRDSRDSILFPTSGFLQQYSLEVGLPGGDLHYYRGDVHAQYLLPLSPILPKVSLSLNGEYGFANGFSGQPLPFFKNFFGGGVGSVRGYTTNTLGPKDPNNNAIAIGGNRLLVMNTELLFPFPGSKLDKSLRLSTFFDAGNVFGAGDAIGGASLRYSGGFALTWYSPVGPLKLSYAVPIRKQPLDNIERLQFTLGQSF
jgi:outer membrane protein insertion porin family